ncbi:MAG TPA: LUD domain-containing protein [Ktedonobacteraceae bacterium]|nr:LUD domain-containing protein [Ktedonobacteraceae bacterium]
MTTEDLFTHFQQRLTAVGGACALLDSVQAAAAVIESHPALEARDIVVPPGFADHPAWGAVVPLLREQGITIREAGSPASVADAPAGLSGAELAVAETGSVLLAENALAARVVSMLTLTHFVLVRAADLVPMLDDIGGRLQQLTRAGADQRHHITLVSGPSRTADIERTLTIGVQGPKAIVVLIVRS